MDGRRSSLGQEEEERSHLQGMMQHMGMSLWKDNYENPDFHQSQSIPSADLLHNPSLGTATGPLSNEQTKEQS
jgi:hypothetical protein